MRVCHMTSAHEEEDDRIFHRECVSLAAAGYEVYLVERGASYDKKGVHIIGVGEIPDGRLRRMTEGARKVYEKALELDCDIYHLHDPELLPYGMKLKRKGKKVIFDSHELTREQIRIKPYLPKRVAGLISSVYSRYENRVCEQIDAVIYPCPMNGQFPLPGKKQVYINNLPRTEIFYDRYDPTVERMPGTICTVGSLSYSRGIKQLIQAAYKAGAKLYLGGTFNSEEFEAEIRAMPESVCTEFLGQLNWDEVYQLLNKCQIGASSILNVGQYGQLGNLPTKVYECMSMALPVILTRTPYNESTIRKYQYGICVDPENIDEFAGAIRYLMDHPEECRSMGENGRKAVVEEFSWQVAEKALLDLYQSLS